VDGRVKPGHDEKLQMRFPCPQAGERLACKEKLTELRNTRLEDVAEER
jgi:hypothetical protein